MVSWNQLICCIAAHATPLLSTYDSNFKSYHDNTQGHSVIREQPAGDQDRWLKSEFEEKNESQFLAGWSRFRAGRSLFQQDSLDFRQGDLDFRQGVLKLQLFKNVVQAGSYPRPRTMVKAIARASFPKFSLYFAAGIPANVKFVWLPFEGMAPTVCETVIDIFWCKESNSKLEQVLRGGAC